MTTPSTDNNPPDKNQLFKRPPGILLDEKQWVFLKNRYHMTSREIQVAILVCRGFNNDEIAKALNISHGTVKTHLRNLYRRVRVKSKILLLLRFMGDVNQFHGSSQSDKAAFNISQVSTKPQDPSKTSQKA